jgi:hypothetical protein
MKTLFNISARFKNEKGVTFVYVAILIVAFLGMAALAIDVGYLMVGRTELQRTADAAALAATRQLGVIYEGMSYAAQTTYNAAADEALIKSAATKVALKNRAAGTSVIINPADIQIGKWTPTGSPRFTSSLLQPDAVQVVAVRDDTSPSGFIGTFFAPAFSTLWRLALGQAVDPADWQKRVVATATAALTGESTAGAGGLPIPLGISQIRADKGSFCGDNIILHPTKDSCAGWHTFESKTHSAEQLRTIIEDSLPAALRDSKYKKDDPYISPPAEIYKTDFNFTGGDIATVFDNFEKLFNYMKTRDGDGSGSAMCQAQSGSKLCDEVWTTAVVIYQENGATCGNPQNDVVIVGFATMVIEEVVGPAGKTIYGKIACNYTEPGRGGGGNYGTKGSIPGLVQ